MKKIFLTIFILLSFNNHLMASNSKDNGGLLPYKDIDMLPADSICVDSGLNEIPQMYEKVTSKYYWEGKERFELHNLSFDIFEYKKNEIVIALVYDKQSNYVGFAFCSERGKITKELTYEISNYLNNEN